MKMIKLSTIITVMALSACSNTQNTTWSSTVLNEVVELETAKNSTSHPRVSDETLFRVCMNYSQYKETPQWKCHEAYVYGQYAFKQTTKSPYISSHEITQHTQTGTTSSVIQSVIEHGFSVDVDENGDYVQFSLVELLQVKQIGNDSWVVEMPETISCNSTVPYTAINSSGFIGERCYYEYSKFEQTL